ncbi:MAG: hypothetical protein AAF830_07645 [Pseudomonadota bacterium]
MDALVYLFSLGFSGSDAARAALLLLLGALFITKRFPPWRMTVLLIIIDVAWPYVAMAQAGAGPQEINTALRGAMQFHEDAVVGFLVRLTGFYVFLRGTFSVRRKLQAALPEDKSRPGLLPF